MARILSYGSLNLDYVYHVPHFVAPGETLFPTARELHCGGKGLNQSVAAARAGGTVFHAGKIGRDGQLLADVLRDSGVDLSLLSIGDGSSGHAIIQVEPGGQNCILLYGGSNRENTPQEMDQALERFGPGDYLMLQNEMNGLDYLMERAAQRGVAIVFNPSPIDETIFHLPLRLVSLLVLNEIEGAALSGGKEEEQILDTLRHRWPDCRLLLTLGSRGCIYDDGTRRLSHDAYRVNVVDTTAAGDTFTGYFVSCLADGMGPEKCMALASQASAIAVSRPGAAPSIPTMREVLKFSALFPG
ncbi:MAG: ribokinase [Lawsonibacter sp.]